MKYIYWKKISYSLVFLSAGSAFCSSSTESLKEESDLSSALTQPTVKTWTSEGDFWKEYNTTMSKEERQAYKTKQKEYRRHVLSSKGGKETYDQQISVLQTYLQNQGNVDKAQQDKLCIFFVEHSPSDNPLRRITQGFWHIALGKYIINEERESRAFDGVKHVYSYTVRPEARPELILNYISFLEWQDGLDKKGEFHGLALNKLGTFIDRTVAHSQHFFLLLEKCKDKEFHEYEQIIEQYIADNDWKTSPPAKIQGGIFDVRSQQNLAERAKYKYLPEPGQH